MTSKNRLLSKIVTSLSVFLVLCGLVSCTSTLDQASVGQPSAGQSSAEGIEVTAAQKTAQKTAQNAQNTEENLETAIFAGGCFWCMEAPFDALPGVVSTTSGYTGGSVENPSYEQVSSGGTGHFEAMKVVYDPKQVSYETLLSTFWVNVDPVDARGQFCDKGDQYRSAIFYDTPEQQALAEDSKDSVATKLAQPIATALLPAAPFYDAEDYHQNYYQTHAVRYKVYRYGCGRDQRLASLWGADAPKHD